jgi:hypothetical protein
MRRDPYHLVAAREVVAGYAANVGEGKKKRAKDLFR